MVVAIHQPHYLPWLRYFGKIACCDAFVLLDDAQYEKNGFQNRNKIKTADGWSYLTVPVSKPTQRPIREIAIAPGSDWREKHRRALELHYRKAPAFERYWGELAELYEQEWTHLAPLNRAQLELFMRQLGLNTPVYSSGELPTSATGTERLVELCRAVGATAYLTGAYALTGYLEPERFAAAEIRLLVHRWTPPVYPQRYPQAGFVPDLAIVDLLWNEGDRARDHLLAASRVVPWSPDRD